MLVNMHYSKAFFYLSSFEVLLGFQTLTAGGSIPLPSTGCRARLPFPARLALDTADLVRTWEPGDTSLHRGTHLFHGSSTCTPVASAMACRSSHRSAHGQRNDRPFRLNEFPIAHAHQSGGDNQTIIGDVGISPQATLTMQSDSGSVHLRLL